MQKQFVLRSLLLVMVLGGGLIAQKVGLIDFDPLQVRLAAVGRTWWMPPLLVATMVVFYALALPGTLVLLTAGMIYPPLIATPIAVAGGVGGALAAYYTARYLSDKWSRKMTHSSIFQVIKNRAGFFLFCTLRIFPGFPHSAINYSAGILSTGLMVFTISTIIGFTIKGFVYTSAVYNATHSEEAEAGLVSAFWPLLTIVVLSIIGYFIKNLINGRVKLVNRNNQEGLKQQ